MGRRKRVALYGGSFDPVHVGHLAVARRLLELFSLDELVFVPAHVAPHKRDRRVGPAFDRYAMLALATQGEPRLKASRLELETPERPYTVETLTRFLALYGDAARLFFVMGADSWEEITTWREWERVLTMTDHLVVTRPGHELDARHVTQHIRDLIADVRGATPARVEAALAEGRGGTRIYLTDAASVAVSSTDVRRAAGEGGVAGARLEELVAPPVAEYVRKYGLYREQDTDETELNDAGNKQTH
jgi:nicotinate-nucleotide adenylyltransferase